MVGLSSAGTVGVSGVVAGGSGGESTSVAGELSCAGGLGSVVGLFSSDGSSCTGGEESAVLSVAVGVSPAGDSTWSSCSSALVSRDVPELSAASVSLASVSVCEVSTVVADRRVDVLSERSVFWELSWLTESVAFDVPVPVSA